ncbi:MAG: EAL domain-containing protein [Gammaproteobacteria bacterium]|nr:EAL domain-containing protein [Gammaproteobacteria bacterium]
MKLPLKILLFLLPLIIIPLLILGWIAYGEFRHAAEQSKFNEMEADVERLAAQLNTKVSTAIANVELFSTNNVLKKYVLNDDKRQRYRLLHGPLMRVFQGFQQAYPDYYEIRVLLPDGSEDIRRTNMFLKNVSEDESDSDLFRQLGETKREEILTTITNNSDNGEISLFVGKPLVLSDHHLDPLARHAELRGYLVLTVALNDIGQYIENKVIGKRGHLVAVTDDGSSLFQPSWLDQKVSKETRQLQLTTAPEQSPGRRDSLSYDEYTFFSRVSRPQPNFNIIANFSADELNEITSRLALTVLFLVFMAIAATTVFVYLLVHRLVIRRIHKLANVTREITRGNLEIKSDVNDMDEIGELAGSVDKMAESLRHSDDQIRYLAYHDSLTGLPNRAMFRENLEHLIEYSRRNEKEFAIMFLDIDDFKRINDSLGHHIGDLLLQEVSRRISHALRKSDYMMPMPVTLDQAGNMLARLGGDEFTMLLPDIVNDSAPGTVARRLIEKLSEPMDLEGHEFFIGASLGITIFPLDGQDPDELLKMADIAMYHAKEQGKNNYQYYRESMNRAVHEKLEMENNLRKAIANDELYLEYQPQYDIESGQMVGMEALVRWNAPDTGIISPAVFIPLAEETGLILPLGEWVLNEACRQMQAWQQQGMHDLPVSVNISNIQFARQDVSKMIRSLLTVHDLEASQLAIEITESTIMCEPESATEKLKAVKDLGVNIALDDFGTGYSSLSYLHRFPIDTLKIDKSFIDHLGKKDEDAAIVSAIIAMAHILKLKVVAEGIERQDQLSILKEHKCDVIQGFLLSKPVAAERILELATVSNNWSQGHLGMSTSQ